ncbi:hypothetical protein OX283_004130 [Flavobacterium sp. SUN052]|uniref:hypothetical protein n=1 Tax=Flavobacterium sp. SUN052 TaxID=3002441 RepID=UPI00237E878E|nr:hypothetical protein [Flavobacterium sp. SUN052]MEC4003833.1 hypothetical protein [Flavobacterium sp. SUN052]
MKYIITSLLLLLGLQSFSQEIKFENGKFYKDGLQISTFETTQLLVTNYKALSRFKKGKSKESLGFMLTGIGAALITVDLVKGLVSDVQYPSALTYVGVGFVAVSIPILSGRNKKIREGINFYNDGLKTTGQVNSDLQVSVISNQNGYGFRINF